MTISTTVTSIQFAGNGATTEFEFPARVFSASDLMVQIYTSDAWVTLTIGTDYTVEIDLDGIATVTPTEIVETGEILDIRSNIELLQPTDIKTLGRFLPEIHENVFDRLLRQIQDVDRRYSKTIRFSDVGETDGELDPISDWLQRFLYINASGELEPAASIAQTTLTQSIIAQLLNPRTQAEINKGAVPTNYWIPSHSSCGEVRPQRYGLVSDGAVSDQTAVLVTAYAVAAEARCPIRLPAARVRFTSNLAWDSPYVSVLGASRQGSTLVKDISGGDFVGITISNAERGSSFREFTLTTTTGSGGTPPAAGSGHGIEVGVSNHIAIEQVDVFYQTGHGIYLNHASSTGNFNCYSNLGAFYNGVDGIRVNNHSSGRWDNINSYGNTGFGFNIPMTGTAHSFHTGNVTCQANIGGGAKIASQNNALQIYGEANTGADITLTVDSFQNLITAYHADTAPGDITDLGTRNIILCVSADRVASVMTPFVTRPQRTTNVTGDAVSIKGGQAGAGASPFSGGSVSIEGGDAAGTGNANGGPVVIRGGAPVGTGLAGVVYLAATDGPIVGNQVMVGNVTTMASVSAGLELNSTTHAFIPNKMTTAQRDGLTPVDGMIIYNTTTNKFQGRAASAWIDFH